MKPIELIIIILLSTGCSLLAWLALSSIYEGGFFDSFYTAALFPPIFVCLFLFVRHLTRKVR